MKTTSRWVFSRQQSAAIVLANQVAARGAPEERCTRARMALTAGLNISSRPKLKNRRAENMIWTISALNTARITPALNTWPAADPATEATKALKGAGLRSIDARSGALITTTMTGTA